MEERILDKERGIKIKKTAAGGIADAAEQGSQDAGAESEAEEFELELPFDETDEDLIGLSPSQLKAELDRREREREKAAEERDRLLAEGERLLGAREYAQAAPFFSQAVLYDPDCERAEQAFWICKTEDFTRTEALFDPDCEEVLRESGAKAREFLAERAGDALAEELARCEAEAKPLSERVRAAQSERREAFVRNRNYFRIRLILAAAVFAVLAVGAGVSGAFIVRTQANLPVILTACFGGAAVLAAAVCVFLLRKLYLAEGLVRRNETLSSTRDGERLEELERRIGILNLVLDSESGT